MSEIFVTLEMMKPWPEILWDLHIIGPNHNFHASSRTSVAVGLV